MCKFRVKDLSYRNLQTLDKKQESSLDYYILHAIFVTSLSLSCQRDARLMNEENSSYSYMTESVTRRFCLISPLQYAYLPKFCMQKQESRVPSTTKLSATDMHDSFVQSVSRTVICNNLGNISVIVFSFFSFFFRSIETSEY